MVGSDDVETAFLQCLPQGIAVSLPLDGRVAFDEAPQACIVLVAIEKMLGADLSRDVFPFERSV